MSKLRVDNSTPEENRAVVSDFLDDERKALGLKPSRERPMRQHEYRLMTVAQQEEHRERIEAMLEDFDAETWDLSDNDRAALRFALACIDRVMDRETEDLSK